MGRPKHRRQSTATIQERVRQLVWIDRDRDPREQRKPPPPRRTKQPKIAPARVTEVEVLAELAAKQGYKLAPISDGKPRVLPKADGPAISRLKAQLNWAFRNYEADLAEEYCRFEYGAGI